MEMIKNKKKKLLVKLRLLGRWGMGQTSKRFEKASVLGIGCVGIQKYAHLKNDPF